MECKLPPGSTLLSRALFGRGIDVHYLGVWWRILERGCGAGLVRAGTS